MNKSKSSKRKYKKLNKELRRKVYIKFLKTQDADFIAFRYDISVSTVYRIVEEEKENDRLKKEKRKLLKLNQIQNSTDYFTLVPKEKFVDRIIKNKKVS